MKKIGIILMALFLSAGVAVAAEITFEWDANTESDLAGYNLYHGAVSRLDESLNPDQVLKDRQERCLVYPTPEKIAECKDGWAAFCSDPDDPLCDYDFYKYDHVIDLGDVTTYTLMDVGEGPGFYAVSAYDEAGNESKFSEELSMVINTSRPGAPQKFKATIRASKVTVETD